jgi:hypothetical protein
VGAGKGARASPAIEAQGAASGALLMRAPHGPRCKILQQLQSATRSHFVEKAAGRAAKCGWAHELHSVPSLKMAANNKKSSRREQGGAKRRQRKTDMTRLRTRL